MMSTKALSTGVAPARTAPALILANWLLNRVRTTPGRLEAAMLTLFIGSVFFWIVTAAVFSDLGTAVRTIGRDTVPSIVAAEKIAVALAHINVSLANATLAKPGDSNPSWRTINEESGSVGHALIAASENITYGGEEEGPIFAMQSNLPAYFRLLGQAQARMQADPMDDVNAASNLMQQTILPAALKLDEANFGHLTAIYDAHRANQNTALIELLCAICLPLDLLIAIQLHLTRATRRVFNLPLLGATAVLAISGMYLTYVFVAANNELRAAKQDSFDSIHALWRARAVAYDANADEGLYLLERGTPGQKSHMDALFMKSAQLLDGLPPAQAIEQAAAGRFQDIKGFIGAELNNITYPGEREAATEMLRTFVTYLGTGRQIRNLDDAGRHAEALTLYAGSAPGQGSRAFGEFDKALMRTLDINESFFARQTVDAFALLAWISWVLPAVALAVAFMGWSGLQARISEYRQ